ncbi:MAG: hypothetical protein AAF696_14180 [Bacteroidota bacterium]
MLGWPAKTYAQNSGVGVVKPTHTFHVKPANNNPVPDPVRFENLQPLVAQSDSMVLVVDPAVGVLRVIHIDQLRGAGNSRQNAAEVELTQTSDLDGDGNVELSVQDALDAIYNNLPKGTFKTIGEARAAGLVDGDSFIAHPEGVLGCAGCTIKLYPGMN